MIYYILHYCPWRWGTKYHLVLCEQSHCAGVVPDNFVNSPVVGDVGSYLRIVTSLVVTGDEDDEDDHDDK